VGDLARHLDAPLVFAGDLALDQKGQRLAQAQLALGRLVQQTVELVTAGRQLYTKIVGTGTKLLDGRTAYERVEAAVPLVGPSWV
jgi:hypothetical protein